MHILCNFIQSFQLYKIKCIKELKTKFLPGLPLSHSHDLCQNYEEQPFKNTSKSTDDRVAKKQQPKNNKCVDCNL